MILKYRTIMNVSKRSKGRLKN